VRCSVVPREVRIVGWTCSLFGERPGAEQRLLSPPPIVQVRFGDRIGKLARFGRIDRRIRGVTSRLEAPCTLVALDS
jgi:hypothetical protein